MKKITFRAINGGGSYTISVEGDKETWGKLNQQIVFDYEANAIAKDAKKDGYKIEWQDPQREYIEKVLNEYSKNS